MNELWGTTRSVLVVALAAVFTVFALAEGMTTAADPAEPASARVLAACGALAPVIGGLLTHRLLRERRGGGPALLAAAWVALALANAALLALLILRRG